MANVNFKGINVRQSGTLLLFVCSLKDSNGDLVTTGITTISILEEQSNGTFKTYDFSSNTFKDTAVTNYTDVMTHQQSNNNTVNLGLWTYPLATLTGFTRGANYITIIQNSNASPTQQERQFVYGSVEGDPVVDGSGAISSNLKKINDVDTVLSGNPANITFYSTISNYAGADSAGVTTLLSRLTSQRSTNLDNLDDAISDVITAIASVATTINTINTNIGTNGNGLTNIPRTGYILAATGLDTVRQTLVEGYAENLADKLNQLYNRFYGKTDKNSTIFRTYDGNDNIITVQNLTKVGSTELLARAEAP